VAGAVEVVRFESALLDALPATVTEALEAPLAAAAAAAPAGTATDKLAPEEAVSASASAPRRWRPCAVCGSDPSWTYVLHRSVRMLVLLLILAP
jgi:hypothetical protein